MPPPKKIPPGPAGSNVYLMSSPPVKIDKQDGWQLRNKHGHFMRVKPGDAGRLVLLSDVMRWLEDTMSREAALKVLCDGLTPDVMTCLYQVDTVKEPVPIPPDAPFGYQSMTGQTPNNDPTSHGTRKRISFVNSPRFARDW